MTRKSMRRSRYLIVLLIIIIILMFSLFIQFIDENNKVGYFAKELRYDEISYQDLVTQRQYINFLIENNETYSCTDIEKSFDYSIQTVYTLSNKLSDYLNQADFVWEEYSYLRQRLINYQIEYWILAKKIDDVCDSNYETVLYFFSNADTCSNCQDQAIILNHLRIQSGDKLLIFALDATFDGTISLLVDKYNVTNDEVTIVVGDTPYNYKSIEELSKILCKDNNFDFCLRKEEVNISTTFNNTNESIN